jgi:type III restriction enzyme
LRLALESKIFDGKRKGMQKVHQMLLLKPEQFISDGHCELIFQEGRYAFDSTYNGFVNLPKHFFPQIGNLDAKGEEFECALFLATQLEGVKYWLRNVAHKTTSFSLQTGTDRFYPDFLCLMEDGRTLVVEYKNERDWTNDDSVEKRQIGGLWEYRSNGKDLFIMPNGKDWDSIRQKINK